MSMDLGGTAADAWAMWRRDRAVLVPLAGLLLFAPTLALAKKLLRSGADALVIEGMEAGGHIGPVSTSVLAQEMLPELAEDHLIFVAGGIGRGQPCTRVGAVPTPQKERPRRVPPRTCTKIIIIK